jgi:hypothetical protein
MSSPALLQLADAVTVCLCSPPPSAAALGAPSPGDGPPRGTRGGLWAAVSFAAVRDDRLTARHDFETLAIERDGAEIRQGAPGYPVVVGAQE